MAARASSQNKLPRWPLSPKRLPLQSYARRYPRCKWHAETTSAQDDASSFRSGAPFHLLCRSGTPAAQASQAPAMACRLLRVDPHRASQLPVLSRSDWHRSSWPFAMIPPAALESMPVRVDDARRLANFCGDEPQLLLGKAEDVHLNVERVVCGALGDDAPGQNIEILETLQDAGNRPWVIIRDDTQAP